MIAANLPIQRPPDAKVLVVDRRGHSTHRSRSEFVNLLRPGDVVVANDAATLPASLFGRHSRTGRPIEVRLAARDSLGEVGRFSAVVFGEGDFRTRTEIRPVIAMSVSSPIEGRVARPFAFNRYSGRFAEIRLCRPELGFVNRALAERRRSWVAMLE